MFFQSGLLFPLPLWLVSKITTAPSPRFKVNQVQPSLIKRTRINIKLFFSKYLSIYKENQHRLCSLLVTHPEDLKDTKTEIVYTSTEEHQAATSRQSAFCLDYITLIAVIARPKQSPGKLQPQNVKVKKSDRISCENKTFHQRLWRNKIWGFEDFQKKQVR